MTSLAWDSSAVLKLIAKEPGSRQVHGAYAACGRNVTLDWTSIELASALWKRATRGATDAAAAELALDTFGRLDFRLVRGARLSEMALGFALRLRHPVYDCMYVALALQEHATLVTADSRLRTIAETAGVHVLWISAD
jgi:predicted nucleic acid-binding protein